MNVEWNGNSAYALKDEMRYKVAYKHEGKVCLTVDGKWLFPNGLEEKPTAQPNPVENVVESAPKKRFRKAAAELDMDDLDI